jgi:pyridoxamine 5'-phosphate oxidase
VSDLYAEVVACEPMQFARAWMDAAAAVVPEHQAMALATVDAEGMPAVRMVLARGLDDRGVTFYTNATSDKGRALLATRRAAATIFHQPLGHQMRFVGPVVETEGDEADAYFASRPRGHQLGAWASQQSAPLLNRATLEAAVDSVTARFADGPVPRPPYWGGFRIEPTVVEFWCAQPDRLHDRVRCAKTAGGWRVERLQP